VTELTTKELKTFSLRLSKSISTRHNASYNNYSADNNIAPLLTTSKAVGRPS